MQPTTIDNSKTIANLLEQLRAETVQANKKKIRRALRALGHRGGLRVSKTTTVEVENTPQVEIEIEGATPVLDDVLPKITRGSAESKKKRGK